MGQPADEAETIWLNARLATLAPERPGLGIVERGAVATRNGQIAFAGLQDELPSVLLDRARIIDCEGRWITPGLVDCHTHLVYGGDRAGDFEMRLSGASYEEIARAGGGILSTVRATRAASEDKLVGSAMRRLDALIAEGVTTIEVKSGYGLETAAERKSLRVARRLGELRPVSVRATFLAAHAIPPEFIERREAYLDAVVGATMPALVNEGLVEAVDAFCESIAFSVPEVVRVFDAARSLGLPVKLHADQLSNGGGAKLAAEFHALSADHLEYTDETGVEAMGRAGVVAVVLPGAFYTLRERQAPPVSLFRKHRVPIAVATDFEPWHLAADVDPACGQHGGDAVRSDGRRMPLRRHAPCGRGARPRCRDRDARDRQMGGFGHLGGRTTGRTRLSSGLQSLARPRLERPMSVMLRPGEARLGDWRAIWREEQVALDPTCRDNVAAGAAAIQRILARGEPVYGINTGFGKLAGVRIDLADLSRLQRNIVLSHATGVGEATPSPVTRLMMALKLGSLAQGASGVRPETIDCIAAMLDRGVTPVVPAQGSVGASGDLAPLAHMAAAMIGVGGAVLDDRVMPAAEALAAAGIEPLVLQPKEGLALLNGTQFSTAHALVGLFEAETLFRSALATGALSLDAARGSDAPFDPRIHALRRHRGQRETAEALRALVAGSEIRASHRLGDPRVQDPYCLRCQPQVMGAALDLLRQAAATLADEANSVSDNPLVFAEDDEALSGGNFHAEPVAFAADVIALALCEIGSLAERRIAMLVDPALSGLPAFLTPNPGLNSGFMLAQVTAAALVSENKQRAYPASVDSIPTSANQEDHVSMAAHAARRLSPMAGNAFSVIGVEWLVAAQGCDFHTPMRSSAPLEALRARLRRHIAHLEDDRYLHPEIAAASRLAREGAIIEAVGGEILPVLELAR